MPQIIAISNQKGGVAKTTTCMSLGACLAEQGQRVLLVDLDPQANLSMSAGLNPDELEWSIVDLLDAVESSPPLAKQDIIQTTLMEGLDLIAADLRLTSIERHLYEQQGYESTLAKLFEKWAADYQYILLDCPPSLGALTLMALTAAQSVLIPVQCEYYAARGLSRLLDIIEAVRERTNPNLSYNILVTMYDMRNRIHRSVLEKLRDSFPDQTLDTIIGVDTRLRECPAAGEPIILYAPRTRSSQQYRQLARAIMAQN